MLWRSCVTSRQRQPCTCRPGHRPARSCRLPSKRSRRQSPQRICRTVAGGDGAVGARRRIDQPRVRWPTRGRVPSRRACRRSAMSTAVRAKPAATATCRRPPARRACSEKRFLPSRRGCRRLLWHSCAYEACGHRTCRRPPTLQTVPILVVSPAGDGCRRPLWRSYGARRRPRSCKCPSGASALPFVVLSPAGDGVVGCDGAAPGFLRRSRSCRCPSRSVDPPVAHSRAVGGGIRLPIPTTYGTPVDGSQPC